MADMVKNIRDVEPVLISKPDSCRLLGGICMRTLENMINAKKLPVRRIGRRTFIPYSALAKFGK
jgi:helix-turn-helix protein